VKESSFNATFRSHLESIAGIKVYRVESHTTCPGIPDDHYIVKGKGITGWMEIKEEETLPNRIDFRPAQVPWHIEYTMHGGRSFVVLFVSRTRKVYLIPGRQARNVSKELRLAAAWEFDFDSPAIWRELGAILSGRPEIAPPDPRKAGTTL
jgi:hypothetical protein